MRTALYLAGALPLVAAQDGRADHIGGDAAFKAGVTAGGMGSVDGVQGVIKLLDTLLDQSIQAKKDRAAEWDADREETCNVRQNVLETEMDNGQTLIDEMKAARTRAEGKEVSESAIVDDCKEQKIVTEGELQAELAAYKAYKKSKKNAIAEATATAQACREAAEVIKNGAKLNLMQGTNMKEQLEPLLGAYKAILYAMSSPEDAKKLKIAMGDDDDLSLVQQPQAVSTAYVSKSGDIVKQIQALAEQFEDQMANMQADLSKRTQEHALLTQSQEDTIKNAKDDGAAAEGRKQTAAENAGNYKGKQEEGEAAFKDNKASYDANAAWCQEAATDFASDQAASSAEIQALKDGLKMLIAEFGGGKSRSAYDVKGSDDFLQISSSDVRGDLVQKLRTLGRKLNSFGLMQLAAAAKSDPFSKIKGLISKMIKKLVADQAAEASEKEACDKEKKANRAALKKATSEHDTTAARKGERENVISDLATAIQEDEASLADLQKYMAEQVEQYNSIAKFCEERVAALKGNQEAMRKALAILEDGPEGDSLNNIKSVLKDVLEDFSDQQTKTENFINKRGKDHTAANSKNAAQEAATSARISGQKSQKASNENDLQTITGDLADDSAELKIAKEALAATVKKCSANIMSHEEKQKRRGDEIEGLKQALDILSSIGGDDSEESFVQKSTKQTFLGYN